MRRWLVVALILAGVSLLAGCGVGVPDVDGMSLDEATQAIASAGFEIGDVAYDEASQGATWTVVAQNPEAGARAQSGSDVSVTLAGPPPTLVPDLAGLGEDEATTQLSSEGLELGSVAQSFDSTVAAGLVTAQDPAPGNEVPKGSSVALTISKGPKPIPIPAVTGKSEQESIKAIESAGFAVSVSSKTDNAPKGTVIAQEPAGGEAQPGSTVSITVSTGVPMTTVPSVMNMRQWDAETKLRAAGLSPSNQGYMEVFGGQRTNLPAGWEDWFFYVVKQDPPAGTKVPKGSSVRFWTSGGDQ